MIHGQMLVRNEGSRFINGRSIFKEVLLQMYDICDTLTIIDDNSTDNTLDFILETLVPKNEYVDNLFLIKNDTRNWNGNEKEVRKQLFEATIKQAKNNDWILCLDSDELFVKEHVSYIKYLLHSLPTPIDSVGFKLFDMWSDTHFRFDNLWKAHFYPWPMVIRYKENFKYVWNDKGLHCGRFPQNSSQAMIPTFIPLKHYGWADEESRRQKYERYMRIDPNGEYGILAQYKSIMDENPNLIEFGVCPE